MITKRTLGCFSESILYFVLFSMNLVYAPRLSLTYHYSAFLTPTIRRADFVLR